jgi:hypothetical protein
MLAEKIASHLANVAAEARVSKGVQRFHEKKASQLSKLLQQLPTMLQSGVTDLPQRLADNPMGYGAGLGALGGSALGGGSTALANLFREKKDRESIFNNTLLGGVAGGALGLSGGAAYKALQETPEAESKKRVTKSDIAAAQTDETIPDQREAAQERKIELEAKLEQTTGPARARLIKQIDLVGNQINLLDEAARNKENTDLAKNPLGRTFDADINAPVTIAATSGLAGAGGVYAGTAQDRLRQLYNAYMGIGVGSDKASDQKAFADRINKVVGGDFDSNLPGASNKVWSKLREGIGLGGSSWNPLSSNFSWNPLSGKFFRPEVMQGPTPVPPPEPPPPPPVKSKLIDPDGGFFDSTTKPPPVKGKVVDAKPYTVNIGKLIQEADNLGVTMPKASRIGRGLTYGALPLAGHTALNYLMGNPTDKLKLQTDKATAATITDQGTNTQQLLRAFGMKPSSK